MTSKDKILRRELILAKIYTAIFYKVQTNCRDKLCKELELSKAFIENDEQCSPLLINSCISALNDNYSTYQITKRLSDFVSNLVFDFQTLQNNFNQSLNINLEFNFLDIESIMSNCFKFFDRYIDKFNQLDQKLDSYLLKVYLNDGQVFIADTQNLPGIGPIFFQSGGIIKDPFNGSYIQNDAITLHNECMNTISEYAALVDDLYENLIISFPIIFKSMQKIATLLRPTTFLDNNAFCQFLDEEFDELSAIYITGLDKIFEEFNEIAPLKAA